MRIFIAIFLILSFPGKILAQNFSSPPNIPVYGNFVYIDQIGSNNNISVQQTDTEQKRASVLLNGDFNDLTILQQGNGNHTAQVGPTNTSTNSVNNSNTLNILQQGNGNHTASILFTNPTTNSNNTASITQKGGVGADKQFTLQMNGSGIGVTVLQDNPLTPDSASMNIMCLTPPCTGYSYSKR
jgi:hypothetical protein